MNVDPAPLRLQDGSAIAVTMRAAKLYFWNSEDGLTFTQVDDFAIESSAFAGTGLDCMGLFDPTLVQLPDGSIRMYVTCESASGSRIVAADITIEDAP